MSEKKRQAVLITTEKRGVFFGYLDGEPTAESVTAYGLRNCLFWNIGLKGFVGLCSKGPNNKCRIGPKNSGASILFGITGVFAVSDKAVEKWEAAPWSK